MKRSAPPLPQTRLDTLFLRVRRDLRHVEMDPDFPARVEAAIRRHERRPGPSWAAIAAAVLLALGATVLKGERGPVHARTLGPPPCTADTTPPTSEDAPGGAAPIVTAPPR